MRTTRNTTPRRHIQFINIDTDEKRQRMVQKKTVLYKQRFFWFYYFFLQSLQYWTT